MQKKERRQRTYFATCATHNRDKLGPPHGALYIDESFNIMFCEMTNEQNERKNNNKKKIRKRVVSVHNGDIMNNFD